MNEMVGSFASSGSSSITSVRREVDYYLNPTELFRWINYRRWDGAKARASSHPEECGTWIVSKNSDGSINWRHLPIHLVCMQCGNASEETVGQVEALLDALLLSYPEGASTADGQGMLPLHLAVSHGATEKFVTSLVACYPGGAHKTDKFGRSPIDIVNDGPPGPRRDAMLQVLRRAKKNMDRLAGSIRKEAAAEVAAVTQSAANERIASQRIIMRLEEELESAKDALESMQHRGENQSQREHDLEEQLSLSNKKLEKLKSDLETVREERDQLNEEIKPLRHKVENHDNTIATLKRNASTDRNEQNKIIAELKSDVATAKAMTDAVENQLRSRFSNEEEMANEISNLESSLVASRGECETEKRKYRELKEQLESENDHLKKSVEDLTKRNSEMQMKISDLHKQLNNLLASYHSLNTEHERIMEYTTSYEHDCIDAVQQERDRLAKSMAKQKSAFENAMTEQFRIMEEASKKEIELQSTAQEERKRANKVISTIRAEFKAATEAERERKIKEASRYKPDDQTSKGINSNSRSRDSSRIISNIRHSRSSRSPCSRRSGGSRISRSSSKSHSTISSIEGKRPRAGPIPKYEKVNITPNPKSSYSSKRHGLKYQPSPTDTTLSSGPAPAGEGHLLRLIEDRAEGKIPQRFNHTIPFTRQSSFPEQSFDDQSNEVDSYSFSQSTDSIGYSFHKEHVNVLATRERYEPSIDGRDEESTNFDATQY